VASLPILLENAYEYGLRVRDDLCSEDVIDCLPRKFSTAGFGPTFIELSPESRFELHVVVPGASGGRRDSALRRSGQPRRADPGFCRGTTAAA